MRLQPCSRVRTRGFASPVSHPRSLVTQETRPVRLRSPSAGIVPRHRLELSGRIAAAQMIAQTEQGLTCIAALSDD